VSQKQRYCGRDFTSAEMETIRALITEHPAANRARLSRLVCDLLGWRKPDGKLKDMSCRVAMIRMQDDGLLCLPPPQKGNGNGKRYRRRTPEAEHELFAVTTPAGQLLDLRL